MEMACSEVIGYVALQTIPDCGVLGADPGATLSFIDGGFLKANSNKKKTTTTLREYCDTKLGLIYKVDSLIDPCIDDE
jgi:hypothetical protein